MIVNINASPFHVGKSRMREQVLATRARENRVIVTYTNTVGGQDELVFDGCSVIVDQTGKSWRGQGFRRTCYCRPGRGGGWAGAPGEGRKKPAVAARCGIGRGGGAGAGEKTSSTVMPPLEMPLDRLDEAYRALVLGVRIMCSRMGSGGWSSD